MDTDRPQEVEDLVKNLKVDIEGLPLNQPDKDKIFFRLDKISEALNRHVTALSIAFTKRLSDRIRLAPVVVRLGAGMDYFFLGLALLGYALYGSEHNFNPSLVFVMTVLGIAVLLYGTGSQAVGNFGATGTDVSDFLNKYSAASTEAERAAVAEDLRKAASTQTQAIRGNIAIAGGAAVLALVFGFGLLSYKDDIPYVFRDQDSYKRISIQICYSGSAFCPNLGGEISSPAPIEGSEVAAKHILDNLAIRTRNGSIPYSRVSGSRRDFVIFDRESGLFSFRKTDVKKREELSSLRFWNLLSKDIADGEKDVFARRMELPAFEFRLPMNIDETATANPLVAQANAAAGSHNDRCLLGDPKECQIWLTGYGLDQDRVMTYSLIVMARIVYTINSDISERLDAPQDRIVLPKVFPQ